MIRTVLIDDNVETVEVVGADLKQVKLDGASIDAPATITATSDDATAKALIEAYFEEFATSRIYKSFLDGIDQLTIKTGVQADRVDLNAFVKAPLSKRAIKSIAVDTGGGDDKVTGSGAADNIMLGDGDDTGVGGRGGDTIVDGAGADRSRGGAGKDTFAFVADGSRDKLLDWRPGDVIAIQGLDGISFDLLTGREIAPGRFVLTFEGDELDVRTKGGVNLDDLLDPGNFDLTADINGVFALG